MRKFYNSVVAAGSTVLSVNGLFDSSNPREPWELDEVIVNSYGTFTTVNITKNSRLGAAYDATLAQSTCKNDSFYHYNPASKPYMQSYGTSYDVVDISVTSASSISIEALWHNV